MKFNRFPTTPRSIGVVKFGRAKTIWLWGMFIPTVILGFGFLDVQLFLLSLVLAFVTLCLGHSVGLHRGIIHRTYETGTVVRGFLAYLFVLSGLGGPISWARLHAIRDYWQSSPDCPEYFAYRHSIFTDFLWNLHLQFEPADNRAEVRLPNDVLSDRWLLFLEKTWILHNLLFATVIYHFLSWEGVVICVCSRTAIGILGHWAIGYSSHVWGEKPHWIPNASEMGTNNWILGLISFGEGFHNNHHAFPKSPRMGLKWSEFDLGWIMIQLMESLGLVVLRTERIGPERSERIQNFLGKQIF